MSCDLAVMESTVGILICILALWRCGAGGAGGAGVAGGAGGAGGADGAGGAGGAGLHEKKGKLLSPFAVVQFPNIDCVSNEGISGEELFLFHNCLGALFAHP